MNATPKRRWFAFSLRLLLIAVAVCGLLFWGAQEAVNRYFSVPLSQEIASFNAQAKESWIGSMEPPLTEEEVIAAIQSRLPADDDASFQVRAIYSWIARTKRLPRNAKFTEITGYSDGKGNYTVWWVNLEIWTSETTGYGLRVRETDYPAYARAEKRRPYVRARSTH